MVGVSAMRERARWGRQSLSSSTFIKIAQAPERLALITYCARMCRDVHTLYESNLRREENGTRMHVHIRFRKGCAKLKYTNHSLSLSRSRSHSLYAFESNYVDVRRKNVCTPMCIRWCANVTCRFGEIDRSLLALAQKLYTSTLFFVDARVPSNSENRCSLCTFRVVQRSKNGI